MNNTRVIRVNKHSLDAGLTHAIRLYTLYLVIRCLLQMVIFVMKVYFHDYFAYRCKSMHSNFRIQSINQRIILVQTDNKVHELMIMLRSLQPFPIVVTINMSIRSLFIIWTIKIHCFEIFFISRKCSFVLTWCIWILRWGFVFEFVFVFFLKRERGGCEKENSHAWRNFHKIRKILKQ